MCESWVMGMARRVYMLCLWWLERFANGKEERGVIHFEYIHDVVVRDS